jgi:hypothetical protein
LRKGGLSLLIVKKGENTNKIEVKIYTMPKKERIRKTVLSALPSIVLSGVAYLFIVMALYILLVQPVAEAGSLVAENSTEWISDNYNLIIEQSLDKASPIFAVILGFLGYTIHRIGKVYTHIKLREDENNRRGL